MGNNLVKSSHKPREGCAKAPEEISAASSTRGPNWSHQSECVYGEKGRVVKKHTGASVVANEVFPSWGTRRIASWTARQEPATLVENDPQVLAVQATVSICSTMAINYRGAWSLWHSPADCGHVHGTCLGISTSVVP